MLLNRFLRKHGFTEHPFSKVAAEKEELLSLYFVQPRYFSEALGDARNPKSYVVFGPRGGGKSAIRSMIERYSNDPKATEDIGGRVLCITYDDFSALNLRQLSTIGLPDHINEVLKRGVPKLAAALMDQGKIGDDLEEQTKGRLRWYIDEYMSDLSHLELDSIAKMLRTHSERVRELIQNMTELYNTVISVLRLQGIQPTRPVDTPKGKRDSISSIHVMEVFTRLAAEFGFAAVYVLVDKVDETDETGGDSQKAAKLVLPILTNIKLLELERSAFKLFLWDKVRSHFGEELREDRISMTRTEWSPPDIQRMTERRVLAYSLNRTNFVDLFKTDIRDNIMNLLITLAYKSPRDMNRLMDAIFAESAPDASDDDYLIGWGSVLKGINRFSQQRAIELYAEETIERLRRLSRTTFTIADVAATFKITGGRASQEVPDQTATNRARNVVEKWKKTGAVQQIDSTVIMVKGRRRSVNQYQVTDPRVAYLVEPRTFVEENLKSVVTRSSS